MPPWLDQVPSLFYPLPMRTLKPRVGLIGQRIKPATTKTLARLSGGKWEGVRERVMRRDFGICQVCKQIGRIVDHRIPLWEGGSNDESNLQVLCTPCHDMKSAEEAKRRYGSVLDGAGSNV